MNREELLEMIEQEVKKLSHDQKEEFFAYIQIISGKTPTNQDAVFRVKNTVRKMQEEGYPVDEKILRYFAG